MDNMQTPEHMPLSDKTLKIAERFANEAGRAARTKSGELLPPRERAAVDFNDYKNACREMLGFDPDKLLTEAMLKERVDYIMQDSKLKLHFPQGSRCFPTIVPFSNMGNPLSAEDVKAGDYLSTFLIGPSGKTINGFSAEPSYVGDFLPAEIQNIAFTIGTYEKDDMFTVTDADRKKVADQYTEAFRKLQKLMQG